MYQYQVSIWRFLCGMVWTAGWLGFGHYFAWVRDLKQTHAYIYGILAIFSGIAIWLFPQPIFFILCAFPAVGGAVVLLCYDYDGRRNRDIVHEVEMISRDGTRRSS